MKKSFAVLCVFVIWSVALGAQTTPNPQLVHSKENSKIHVPAQSAPGGLAIIYNNLGKKTDAYNDQSHWFLSGPNSQVQSITFLAMPFTPKSNSHVSEVRVAVQYSGGANQVNLSLYSDVDGAPGTLLAGPVTVTNLPEFATCCLLTVADFSSTPVIAKTQYWIVADTPLSGTGSDFIGGGLPLSSHFSP
jgi:hypothetical protein